MAQASSDLRAINRLCDILNTFSESERVLTLSEISRKIGLPKSTTFRFLEALEQQGLVNCEPGGRGFRLGFQLIRWGRLAQSSIDLRTTALPILRRLTDQTGETSILSMRFQNVGTWIEMIESPHPFRLAMRVGEPLRLHAGASSKVLWAFLPENQIEELMSQVELTRLERNTITDPDLLRAELQKIRERGYATSFEETDRDAMGVAAPVYNHSNLPVAGIGIAAPVSRVPKEKVPELAHLVVDASQELSRMLGSTK